MQPSALAEARDWLARADEDLAAAPRLIQTPPPLLGTASYHAQQAQPGMTVGHGDGHCVGMLWIVPSRLPARRRPKVTATLDPDLLASVDAYVAVHPDLDRSAVIDEALRLWYARELELALAAQFATADGVDPSERQAWDRLRRVAAARPLDAHDPA